MRATRLPSGVALGALGVLAFSFSFPATKLAVAGLDPWLVAFGRAVIAAALAAIVLLLTRAPRPTLQQCKHLSVVAGGVVIGFPLFTSLALRTTGSAHGAVVIAVLPAATALVAVLLGGERPPAPFWAGVIAGFTVVVAFTITSARGALGAGDMFLLLATAVCAVGYAEGGHLSRELGGARTICWALVLAAPLTTPIAILAALSSHPSHASSTAWLGFAYVCLVSMFFGFFAWYAGLARGGVARIGQIQLIQPSLTVLWSAAILGEPIGTSTFLAGGAALACVAATQRARVAQGPGPARGSFQ